MVNVELLDVADLAQTCDLGVDALKAVGSVELAQPGIVLGTGHVVVGVVTGDDHQRAQDDLGVTGLLDLLDDGVAGGVFLAFGLVSLAIAVPFLWRRTYPSRVAGVVAGAHVMQLLLLSEGSMVNITAPLAVYSVARWEEDRRLRRAVMEAYDDLREEEG